MQDGRGRVSRQDANEHSLGQHDQEPDKSERSGTPAAWRKEKSPSSIDEYLSGMCPD